MSVIKSLKKSNIFLIAIILFLIAIISILLINNNTDKVIISSGNSHKENINTSNALTMMYETEAGSGEYQVSSDTTWPQDGYVFNETLSKCENGGILTWDDENKKVLLQTNTSDKCYVYFDKEPDVIYLADYIKNTVYQGDGVNGLYYHDGVGTYTNADQEVGDNSYRYAGANTNNYVCFGNDAATCPNDNLYRIIGVFDEQVKLIKSDCATSTMLGTDGTYQSSNYYYWNTTSNNVWSQSILNTTNLNNTFLKTFEDIWQEKIAEAIWYVNGHNDLDVTPAEFQIAESTGLTYNAKIGLMYVSDYGYAANPSYWTINMRYYSSNNDNWMSTEYNEWTISRTSNNNSNVFRAESNGSIGDSGNVNLNVNVVRPVFYLNSDVQYISGSGTQSDPFRIA